MVAGTTRDTLQETLVLNGLTIHLTDTAGLRQTADKVEKIGIDRAKNAISQADILLLVYDVSGEIDPMLLAKELFSEGDYGDFDKLKQKLIFVANKTDLLVKMNVPRETLVNEILISCQTGSGIADLIQVLHQKAGFYPQEGTLLARTRHLDALKRAKIYAQEAHQQLTVYHAGELVAESLRLSAEALGEITGKMSSNELLGRIFSSFCIGK